MNRSIAEVTTRDQFAAIIAHLSQSRCAYKIPLYRAAQAGTIALCEFTRDGIPPLKRLDRTGRPVVVLLGDDDHAVPDGPDTWPRARRVLQWASFVVIHGSAGRPEHYEHVIDLTSVHRRVAMIECGSHAIPAWQAAAERWAIGAHGLTIQPPPGCPHPSLDRSRAQ